MRTKGQGSLINLRTQIRWLFPFQSLAQTEDKYEDVDRPKEPLPNTHPAEGIRGMSRFSVDIRKLDAAKFSLFRKQTPQSRTWSPLPCARCCKRSYGRAQPGQAEQVPTQGPGAPGQAGPTPGNRTDTPERLEVWNARDSKTL